MSLVVSESDEEEAKPEIAVPPDYILLEGIADLFSNLDIGKCTPRLPSMLITLELLLGRGRALR